MNTESNKEIIGDYLKLKQYFLQIDQIVTNIKQEAVNGCSITPYDTRIQIDLKTLSLDFAIKLNMFTDKFIRYLYKPFASNKKLPLYFPHVKSNYEYEWDIIETFENNTLKNDMNYCMEDLLNCEQFKKLKYIDIANEHKHSNATFDIRIVENNIIYNYDFNITFVSERGRHKNMPCMFRNSSYSFSIILDKIYNAICKTIKLFGQYYKISICKSIENRSYFEYELKNVSNCDSGVPNVKLINNTYGIIYDNNVKYVKYNFDFENTKYLNTKLIDNTGIIYDSGNDTKIIYDRNFNITSYDFQIKNSENNKYILSQSTYDFIFNDVTIVNGGTQYIKIPFTLFKFNLIFKNENYYGKSNQALLMDSTIFTNMDKNNDKYWSNDGVLRMNGQLHNENLQFLKPISNNFKTLYSLYKNKRYYDFYRYYKIKVDTPFVNDILTFYKTTKDDEIFKILLLFNIHDNLSTICFFFRDNLTKGEILIKYINKGILNNKIIIENKLYLADDLFNNIVRIYKLRNEYINNVTNFIQKFLYSANLKCDFNILLEYIDTKIKYDSELLINYVNLNLCDTNNLQIKKNNTTKKYNDNKVDKIRIIMSYIILHIDKPNDIYKILKFLMYSTSLKIKTTDIVKYINDNNPTNADVENINKFGLGDYISRTNLIESYIKLHIDDDIKITNFKNKFLYEINFNFDINDVIDYMDENLNDNINKLGKKYKNNYNFLQYKLVELYIKTQSECVSSIDTFVNNLLLLVNYDVFDLAKYISNKCYNSRKIVNNMINKTALIVYVGNDTINIANYIDNGILHCGNLIDKLKKDLIDLLLMEANNII